MVWRIYWKCSEDEQDLIINYHQHCRMMLNIINIFATTSKIKNRCSGFWWNVFEIFFGGREEQVMINIG
jgi:hypothetical protein